MEIVLILIVLLAVGYKLGLFNPIVDLTEVATRESSAYNREHKVKVAKRYEKMAVDLDTEKVNANIAKVEGLRFD